MTQRFITPNQAAQILGLSRTAVWKRIKSGKIPFTVIKQDGIRPLYLIDENDLTLN